MTENKEKRFRLKKENIVCNSIGSKQIFRKTFVCNVKKRKNSDIAGHDMHICLVLTTSAWPSISSAQLFHCGHLSRSAKVVSLDVQQHCSWLNHMALRHTPSFRSFIQSAAMSIRPAKAPNRRKKSKKENSEDVRAGSGKKHNRGQGSRLLRVPLFSLLVLCKIRLEKWKIKRAYFPFFKFCQGTWMISLLPVYAFPVHASKDGAPKIWLCSYTTWTLL